MEFWCNTQNTYLFQCFLGLEESYSKFLQQYLVISTGEELSKESCPSDPSCSVVLKKVFVSKESPTPDWLISHLLLLLVAGVGILHSALPLVRYLYIKNMMMKHQLRKRRRNPKIARAFGQSMSALICIVCITDMLRNIFRSVYFSKHFFVNIILIYGH